ncbi:KxYKxGKxW signal peptide domain-containing protein [Lentilactobacillus buchneri subsp. silagei]
MTKLNRTNSKVHYKMYKAGKHWLYASLLTVGLMAGGAFGAKSITAPTN